MKLHRTPTATAVVGILSAGGALATAASSSAAIPSNATITAAHSTAPLLRTGDHGPAVALHGSPTPSGHVALTALVTGTGRHAHLVVHERGAVAGGGPWLGDYDLKLDGHFVDSGTGAANCSNKPVQAFDVTRRPAAIRLTSGRQVIQIRQDYCKTPAATPHVPATHTVAFTAH